MDPQCVSDSPRIPGDNVKCTLEVSDKYLGVFRNGFDSRASGSACSNWASAQDYGLGMKSITWIEEDGALLPLGCGQLDDGEACISSRDVVIVHRDLEVRTFKVGDGGIYSKAFALVGTPGDLKDTQEVGRGRHMRENSPVYCSGVWARVRRQDALPAGPG